MWDSRTVQLSLSIKKGLLKTLKRLYECHNTHRPCRQSTRITRQIGALHTGLTQKTVWYTKHAGEEGEGRGGREGRQARAGVGGVAMAGGGARGGQPGREVRAVGAEAKALAAVRQRMAEGRRRDT